MSQDFKSQLQAFVNEAAASRFKVHQSMTAHLEFKRGCEILIPVLMRAIEQRDLNHECSVGGSYIKSKYNKELLNILKGEK